MSGSTNKLMIRMLQSLVCLIASATMSEENTAAQCAQFGVNGQTNEWDYGNDAAGSKTGYWTIATREFDAKWLSPLGTRYNFINTPIRSTFLSADGDRCPWVYAPPCVTHQYRQCVYSSRPRIEPCVSNNKIRMNIYLVKQDGRILHGWLHVEVELLEVGEGEIELLYIQMRDEKFNAIGEFVTEATEKGAICKPSKSFLATPKHYQFYPCSATGLREAKTSVALMMAKREYYFDKENLDQKKWIHREPIAKGVHFLWKMGEYWCSRHEKIQPYAYVLTSKNREIFEKQGKKLSPARMLRKIPNYWLHPKWFGAADIIFSAGDLDCSELAIDDETGKVTPAAASSWISDRSTPVIFAEDNWHPKNRYLDPGSGGSVYGSNLCQADPLASGKTHRTVPVFSGRCASHFSKDVSTNFFQGCNLDPNSPEFSAVQPLSQFTKSGEYRVKKQSDRRDLCSGRIKCKAPNSNTDLNEIKVYMQDAPHIQKSNTTRIGHNDVRTKSKVYRLRAGAKFHGILCSVIGLFLTPVYIFAARYYKETFLNIRRFSTPWWYWIHFMGSIIAGTLFASGFGAISWSIKVWGRSEDPNAVLHMYTGYASLCIFIYLLLFGWSRCGVQYVRGGRFLRYLSLGWHATLGFAHHILNLITIENSVWIPRSPSLSSCDGSSGLPDPDSKGPIYIVVLAFIVTDVLFHLLTTVFQYDTDRPFQVRRRCWLPLLPLLPISSITDYAGSAKRKIILYIYLVVMSAYTIAAIYFIATKDMPDNCKSGPMSCKHAFGCTKLAIQYENWFKSRGGHVPQTP